ncbi:MAG: selenium-dependent molybdenum cofactor biosynthesis protein YqeB [Anaerolineales bacterium]|nr:selenium-dependent molybdenum cofactor biosynthesis protein YqeB [Anaerolineales bacterium]MCX7609434.1 selenium-dependent molybdenum cofactor biosynthesis protein YqeB [Anaerolineales bacterium]MDW8227822.1 selenium-dependent molybdenum cofactor biosynthesis protein YqeB [Anaerolineales bacterium]
MPSILVVRGGGEQASGVVVRLLRAGLRVVVTELAQPLCVRRTVCFAEAIYRGEITIEGHTGRRVDDPTDMLRILNILGRNQVPVLVDPDCKVAGLLHALAVVDGRMLKRPPEPIGYVPALYIGLGPGFIAGVNCQVAIETQRGHTLGRVYWQGGPQADTGLPEGDPRRVLRAPTTGILLAHKTIGDLVESNELIAEIQDESGHLHPVTSPFRGVLRGLLYPGLHIAAGIKIGDVDPRGDPSYCYLVSDKALAIGGGVLEALLTRPEIRARLWT